MAPARGRKAVRICIFNHKGGVGKTTLTVNLAATLCEMGRKVLLIDSDPQCNLTSYLVDSDVVDDLLDNSDGEKGKTVWSALKPVHEAEGQFKVVKPLEVGLDGLFLLPGDIRLSEFESDLAEFWALSFQRKTRGFRGTTALSELVGAVSDKAGVDYVFYDAGPNIGPLNRAILLDCDYFIVPVACDLFSLRALKTLGRTLTDWIQQWASIAALAPSEIYMLPGRPAFLGYVPEGFKVYGGAVAAQHSQFLSRIEKEIYSQLVTVFRQTDPKLADGTLQQFKLGQVKHLGALIPASQSQGVPVYAVDAAGSAAQRASAHRTFRDLAKAVDQRVQDKKR